MRARTACLLGAALLAILAFGAAPAGAATGDLSFLDCDASKGEHGCDAIPSTDGDFSSVGGAAQVLSFGDDVYVASLVYSAITWFDRAADGSLSFDGCIADNGEFGCVDPESGSLYGANGLAVSADGESLYLAATGNGEAGAINYFERSPDGSLAFQGCISNEGEYACEDAPHDSITGAWEIALAGEDAYVVSTSGFLTRFSRDGDGSLSYEDCFADGETAGCADPGGEDEEPLLLPTGIAASPDGASIYVTGGNASSLIAFTRNPANGALTYQECHANLGLGGCEDPPKDSFGQPSGVVVSPDGANVYVSSLVSDSVTSFTRGAGGALTYQNCVANGGENECVDPAIDALARAMSVAIDPAGTNVYISTEPVIEPQKNGAVITLSRGGAGALSFQGCIANDGVYGCEDPPSDSIAGSDDVAISEDGQSIYVASYWGNAVTTFELEAVPLAPLLTDTDPDSPENYNSPAIKGSAQVGSTVRVYTNAACTGLPVKEGTAAQLGGSGLIVTVLDNSTTTFYATASDAEGASPCSAGIVYEEVSAGPSETPTPVLTGTDPPSPANDNTPRIVGAAEAGTTVHVYTDAACAGGVEAIGTAAQLAAPGIQATVADNSTTTFYATATGADGTSACSAGLTYVEQTPDPSDAAGLGSESGPGATGGALVAAAPLVAAPGRAVVLGGRAIVRAGKAKLRVACRGAAGERCEGVLRLAIKLRGGNGKRARKRNLLIGRARYLASAGQRRNVAVSLTRRGIRLVKRRGRRGLKVKVTGRRLSPRSLRLSVPRR